MRKRIGRIVLAAGVGTGLLFYFGASAAPAHRSPAIIQGVDESKLVTLHGNTHPDAISANDRGQVGDDLHLDHLLLQLKRLPQDQAALEQFLAEQQDPQSPNFHKWLNAAELGERFGAVDQDVNIITGWLRSHGFAVNEVHPSRMVIDFSGTAGQVREAFHTEIHNLEVNATRHIGNMSDPRIPEALAAAVEGIVSLHDFMPHPMNSPRTGYTFTSGSATYQALVPGDLATIYNFTPVFTGGNTGQGQTVVLIEDSDVYSVSDFNTFRSTFGLPASTLSQVHPSGTAGTCTDPGANSDDSEAEIDVEWASAAAPGATIELASCASTRTTFGGFLALQNLIGAANHPSIVSVSYGESEAQLGAAANAYVNSLYQTASGGGVSVFVSAGDEGAASSDAGALSASHGITVSGFASTPYNTAVGGTDFEDTYLNQNSTYWNATNGPNYASAIKYIPEIPWNDSCASVLIANTLGYSATYGTNGFCNSTTARRDGFLGVVAGSGGPSNCATGAPLRNGIAGGTCKGYAKPAWQSAAGNPGDAVRDIPDVSMFAANGVWGHYYVVCYSDKKNGGVPCTGAPSAWAGFGGTSVSSPIVAGIQALINARTKSSWGVSAPYLYSLAKSKCPGSGCAFNDVVAGDMDVNCTNGSPNCYNPNTMATRGGVLSTSTTAYSIAYGTGPGWDFATGLGSVNVANLLSNWP